MTKTATATVEGVTVTFPDVTVEEIREQAARLPEIEAAFKKVENPTDWKAPIEAVIDEADLEAVREAVDFFTGTTIEATPIGGGQVFVEADGYRAGPAGP